MQIVIRVAVLLFVVLPLLATGGAIYDSAFSRYGPSFFNTLITDLVLIYLYGFAPGNHHEPSPYPVDSAEEDRHRPTATFALCRVWNRHRTSGRPWPRLDPVNGSRRYRFARHPCGNGVGSCRRGFIRRAGGPGTIT